VLGSLKVIENGTVLPYDFLFVRQYKYSSILYRF